MGSFLRQTYGSEMVVFGFAFNRGSFQAIDMINGGLRPFEAPPAAEGTLDAALAATGIPIFALDLRAAPASGPESWIREPHRSRNIGAGYATDYDANYFLNFPAPTAFDAILFVENTTRAVPVN